MRWIIILVTLVSLMSLLALTASAQAFPWNDFKPRTLKDIVKIDAKEINDSEREPRLIAHADMLLSVIRVRYTGKSRPISALKRDLLNTWTKTFTGSSEAYAEKYENDFLFTENGTDYWLPVQKKVSSHFPNELKEGDYLDIYIVRAGGVCIKKVCDWLFLIEEFQQPKTIVSN